MWPLSFPFSPFQHFTRLVNVLSAFPAVYEVLKGKALPTKEQYTFRDIPDTIPVSCLFCLFCFCQKGVELCQLGLAEELYVLRDIAHLVVPCIHFCHMWCYWQIFPCLEFMLHNTYSSCAHNHCLYSLHTQMSVFHVYPNIRIAYLDVFMHTPVVDIHTLAIHACIHIFLHPPPSNIWHAFVELDWCEHKICMFLV